MKNRLYFLSFFAALFHISLFAQTPCTYSTNLPAAMPDGFSGSFQITVSGATNPSLGVNGQRVCGVHLQFQHEYMGDLVVRLINPLGQSVTLVGPHVFAGGTDFTTWDVHFIPCVELANPDPGFTPQWNNNQTWGMDHSYAGTYHPFEGCFEDMTGPVNGTWTLMITDGQAIDQGELFFWGIDFCDPTGLTCTDCAANAGQLSQGDMTVCAGGPPLNLPPTYFIPGLTPPDDEYDYTYVISRKSDGVILGYDANADLGSMNAGNYTVCGFSYRTDAAALLPAPDGSLTTAQLKAQLASSMPPFCGNVSDNCVNITLQPETTDSLLTASICAPGCVTFYNDTYCTSGTYVKNIGPVGCQYTATLVLNIIPAPPVVLLQDTICAGSCSTMPGFENACTSGLYERVLPASQIGQCDTTVQLQLVVLNPDGGIEAPFTILSCTADSLILNAASSAGIKTWTNVATGATSNDNSYVVTEPGLYALVNTLTSGDLQCVQTDTVLITSNPDIIETFAVGGELYCGNTSVQLAGQANGSGLTYNWAGPFDFTSTEQNPSVSLLGTYNLTVSNGQGCSGTATAEVIDTNPVVELTAGKLDCANSVTSISIFTNILDPVYYWIGPEIPANAQFPIVHVPGVYTVVANSASDQFCTVSSSITVLEDHEPPVIETILASSPSGGQQNGLLDIEISGAPGPYTIIWLWNGDIIASTEDLSNVGPGFYTCAVTAANGCTALQSYHLSNNFTSDGYHAFVSTLSIRNNPGPVPVLVHATGTLPVARLRVYDSGGRLVWEQETQEDSPEHPIDLGAAPDGLYFLEMKEDGIPGVWMKMVVQH